MAKYADPEKWADMMTSGISSKVIEVTKKAVDKTAAETKKVIENSAEFQNRTGEYVKAFRITTTRETKCMKVKTWHVESPHYRLTHLLENGHATRNGGRTRAFPHISKGAEYAEKRLEELIIEGLSEIG